MNDHLALLVGKVTLQWGALDQSTYSVIKHLEGLLKTSSAPIEPIDHRFSLRIKRLRRLLRDLSGSDPELLRQFDAWTTRLKDTERQRAHFSHGSVRELWGQIVVSDERERRRIDQQIEECFDSASNDKLTELFNQFHGITYSSEDLQQLAESIRRADGELNSFLFKALRIAREKGIGRAF